LNSMPKLIKPAVKDTSGPTRKKVYALDARVIEKGNGKTYFRIFQNDTLTGKVMNQLSRPFTKKLKLDKLKIPLLRLKNDLDPKLPYFGQVVNAFNFKVNNRGKNIAGIPKRGPVIFYANHPLSSSEVFALGSVIEQIRPDLKAVAAKYLENVPGFIDHAFFVEIFNSTNAVKILECLKKINKHIKMGGALLILPAGDISAWSEDNSHMALDPVWEKGIIKMAEQSPDTILKPIFVEAEPTTEYLKLRKKSQTLSDIYIFREIALNIGRDINLNFGENISFSMLKGLSNDQKMSYLRGRLHLSGTSFFKSKNLDVPFLYEGGNENFPLLRSEELKVLRKFHTDPELTELKFKNYEMMYEAN